VRFGCLFCLLMGGYNQTNKHMLYSDTKEQKQPKGVELHVSKSH